MVLLGLFDGVGRLNRKQIIRLQELVNALHDYIHSIEWEDLVEPCPDETDFGPVGPLCVECGNYGQSCVC